MSAEAPDAVCILRGQRGSVNCLAFHQNDILSGDISGSVQLWDLSIRRRAFELPEAHTRSVLAVESLDQYLFASHGREQRVRIWDCGKGLPVPVGTLAAGSIGFCRMARVEGSQQLVAPHPEQPSAVDFWDLKSLKKVRTVDFATLSSKALGMCTSLCARHTGGDAWLAAGFESGAVVSYSLNNGKIASRSFYSEPVLAIALHPERPQALCGSADCDIIQFATGPTEELQELRRVSVPVAGINDVHVRADGRLWVTAGWDGNLRMFGWKKGRPLCVLSRHVGGVNCARTHRTPAGFLTAAAAADGHISIWDTYAHA